MYIIVIALFAGAFIGVAEALGRKEFDAGYRKVACINSIFHMQ